MASRGAGAISANGRSRDGDSRISPAASLRCYSNLWEGVGENEVQAGVVSSRIENVSARAKNGATGAFCKPEGSPEQATVERDESNGALDNAKASSIAKVTAVPSSPRSSGSEHSRGGARVTPELKPADDDPLSNKETSEWAALWSDKELMQAIEQDVVRTMPDLAFYACRSIEDDDDAGANGSNGSGEAGDGPKERSEHRRRGRQRRLAISRILFVHAKLNPAESYTQGMNEIVATLYFVLATDESEEWRSHCEADTFFCFTNLMAEIRDVFIQSLDESESGLYGKMEAFSRTLRQHDPELASHMVSGRV